MSLRSLLDGYTSCDATYRRGYCLPYDIDLQASQPQFENGSVYRPIRPTRLDKIKNFHLELRSGSVVRPTSQPVRIGLASIEV